MDGPGTTHRPAEHEPGPSYRAVAVHDGRDWRVAVSCPSGRRIGAATVRRLHLADQRVRRLVAGWGGGESVGAEVCLEVRLHPYVEYHLALAEDLCRSASEEVDTAVSYLADLAIAGLDIAAILRMRDLKARPSRPVVAENGALAENGLTHHPDVIAVRWEDSGRFETIVCRACVDRHRDLWVELPGGESVLLYGGVACCEICEAEIEHDTRDVAATATGSLR
jgi:hypothetical protein